MCIGLARGNFDLSERWKNVFIMTNDNDTSLRLPLDIVLHFAIFKMINKSIKYRTMCPETLYSRKHTVEDKVW
jgi:hypothetical protein